MQWFIDVIKELIHSQLGYFNRGDVPAVDFAKVDFTRDSLWHDLDLSAIVPAGAIAVSFACRLLSTNVHQAIQLRRKGNVNAENRGMGATQVANINNWFDLRSFCDADRFIQYKISTDPWTIIRLTVTGWWLQ